MQLIKWKPLKWKSWKGINLDEKIYNFSKHQKSKGLKILTPKQMLQRLIIAYAQVKADNTSENINKMRQRICSLYQTKEVTKKVYYNIINLMKP